MNLDASLAPRFVLFHYSIKWFIEYFGVATYFVGIIGGILAFCSYAFHKSIKADDLDRAVMITIFAFILVGGLIGLGLDISNGYALDPLQF